MEHAREEYRLSGMPAAGAVARTRPIIALASQHGRYGYRRITALLRKAGSSAGKDRVQCI